MKHKILKVGRVVPSAEEWGMAQLPGWEFEGGFPLTAKDGKFLFAGYTLDELREIASRPQEFAELP